MTRLFRNRTPRKARLLRRTLVFALVMLVMGATYAFTNSNSVPATSAGSGSTGISGYTTSTVHYGVNATNPANLDQVTFNLDKAAGDVKIQVAAGGTVYDCGASGVGFAVTCNTTSPQATVLGATSLIVVAISG
jgi:hypothetical protein